MRWTMCIGIVFVMAATTALYAGDAPRALEQFQQDHPQVRLYQEDGRITRVSGAAFSLGDTPERSAAEFIERHAAMLGVDVADLRPGNHFNDWFLQPVMYDADTGDYKFSLLYYAQYRDGVPVYEADVRLLVRNEAGYPLVLVASNLRDVGDFTPDQSLVAARFDRFADVAPEMTNFSEPQTVVWAGRNDTKAEPAVAVTFVADNYDDPGALKPERWRFVCDARTGEVLYKESLIRFADVTGSVSGMATEGAKADICSPEVPMVMAWARVCIQGGTCVYADGEGNFVIPNGGTSPVTIQSYMDGLYFTVDNYVGAEETLTTTVTPGFPYAFMHNEDNVSDLIRSQVNTYIPANNVRDWVLAANPDFPTIATETGFPIYVNRTDFYCPCNAWSDGLSINFCQAGDGCPNTGWQSVLNHEYGHHVIDQGGSGQGAYGEGMADCFSMLPVDDPGLGYGFSGDCDSGLRSADNDYQYPCTGEIHDCGQLLSGCVWSTRNELILTEPDDYLEILSNLAVNSILLHSGTTIDPLITIDFLTLDDDDDNIYNGTPHYPEICAGFGAHNMDCPELETGLTVSPQSDLVSEGPGGGPFLPGSQVYTLENLGPDALTYEVTSTKSWVTITNATGTLNDIGDTAQVTVSINAEAQTLPDGGYHDTVTFTNITDHVGDTTREVTLNVGIPQVVYEWTLDTDPGWTTQGQWAFGHPTGSGGDGGGPDPTNGYTGSNVYGYNLYGDYTDNMPEYHLTTTPVDCTGLGNVQLKFQRWLGVESSIYDHAYVRVSNDGSDWVTIWENGADIADSSWIEQEFDISAVADNEPTVYLRWTMGTTDGGLTFCGWNIDDIQIVALGGEEPPADAPAAVRRAGVPGSRRCQYAHAPDRERCRDLRARQRPALLSLRRRGFPRRPAHAH